MSMLRWALVLLAAVFVAIVPSAATGHAGPGLRGFGTAVIDGAPGSGEWDPAARHEFAANRSPAQGGGTVPATLYVMNDAANLYVALRVSNALVGSSTFRLYFDNDHSGSTGVLGDDGLELGKGFQDLFVNQSPAWATDTSDGGTSDGGGLAGDHSSFSFYELSHPLDNSDDAHDFSLGIGNRIGFDLYFMHCDPVGAVTLPSGCGESTTLRSGDIVRVSGSRVPPDTRVTAGPADRSTTAKMAPFEFTGSDDVLQPSQLTFECKTNEGRWQACTSPSTVNASDGRHTFSVRAVDEMLNADATPAQRNWTLDTTGPSQPVIRGPRSVRKGKKVVLRFSSRDQLAGGVRYRCAVDSTRLRNCPAVFRIKLRLGRHVVRVRAFDRLGNRSRPSTFRIRVKRALR
jgi:hypothetical protein